MTLEEYLKDKNLIAIRSFDNRYVEVHLNKKCKNGRPTKKVVAFSKPVNYTEFVLCDIYMRMTIKNLKCVEYMLDVLNNEES